MKKLAFALVILSVALLTGNASAQWTTGGAPVNGKPATVAKVDEMKTVVTLTDEQVKKIADVVDQTEKSTKALAPDFAPVQADYAKAATDNDQAAMGAAVAKLQELYKKQAEIDAKGSKGIDSVLTAEQLTQWREHKYLKPILALYEKLDLTDAQMTKIRTEFNRCFVEAKEQDQTIEFPWQSRVKLTQLIEKEVLTNGQLEKFVLDPVMTQYKTTGLTDAQVARIKDQLVTLVKGAGPNDTSYQIATQLRNFIQKDVLTDEQRTKAILDALLPWYKIELTDEQVAKIKEQAAKLLKAAAPVDAMAMVSVQWKINAFIQKEVLTDEQREKVILDPTLTAFKKAELTDEQVAKIKDKFKALLKEAKPDDPNWPWQSIMKLYPFINKEVLTDDQRTKMGMVAPK